MSLIKAKAPSRAGLFDVLMSFPLKQEVRVGLIEWLFHLYK